MVRNNLFLKIVKHVIKKILRRGDPTKKETDPYEENSPFFMNKNPKYAQFEIGEWSYGKPIINQGDDFTKLTIGKYCSIADNVQILLGREHRTNWITTYPFNIIFAEGHQFPGYPLSKGDISIGNDVWIGQNTIILSGVTIGNGAVIGAGSIVVKNIPPYGVAAGNPAKLIRYRFSPEIISKLEAIAWWNWPKEKIIEAFPLMLNGSVQDFIDKYYYS